MTAAFSERRPIAPPSFSIIIPTYQRPKDLEACLRAITQLDYPCDHFEVLVINDGDPNLSHANIVDFEASLNIRLIHQDNTGPAGARNRGAYNATGTFLAFTDDDCQPATDWLWSLAAQCTVHPDAAIGGQVINALPNNLFSTASQLHGDAVYDYYNQSHGDATFFAACNFSVPRRLYQQINGFDTSFPLAAGEDREFCDRWLRQGYPMRYIPEALVYHAHHLTLYSFLKQHFNYGRGAFFFHKAREKDKNTTPIKTDLKFYRGLITYPFKTFCLRKACLLSILFIICNLAKTVGFFWASVRDRPDMPEAVEKRNALKIPPLTRGLDP